MSDRVFRISGSDGTRLDADGNSILPDGGKMTTRITTDGGRMRAEVCECDAAGVCKCKKSDNRGDTSMSQNRNDAAGCNDAAVDAYARAIEETERHDSELWRDSLDGALLEQIIPEVLSEPMQHGHTDAQRGDAVDEYARAIEETEHAGRNEWRK
jgi:hypothetical protein